MPATVEAIINSVILEISQVPGTSTQIYATPRLLQYVEDAFDLVFAQNWWDEYTSFVTRTLDGTTGRLTADIIPVGPLSNVPISSYRNIRTCFPSGSNRPVRELPPLTNPNTLTGQSLIYKSQDNLSVNRPIIFFPSTSTGDVVMEVRQEPLHPFALTDTIYFDTKMLVLGAAFLYAADDGTNPGQVAKFESQFTKRVNDMIGASGDTKLQLDPRFAIENDQWWELG